MDWVKSGLSSCVMVLVSALRHRRRAVRSLLLIAAAIAIITSYRGVPTSYHLNLLPRETKEVLFPKEKNNATKACVLPNLDPFHESMMSDVEDDGPLKCKGQIYTTLTNGVLRVRKGVRTSNLELSEIKRVSLDDFEILRSDLPLSTLETTMENNRVLYKVPAEFIQVNLKNNWKSHKEFHLQTVPKSEVIARPVKPEGMGLNVLMLMFDSTSAAQFQRKMRRSLEYLSHEVESIFFKGEGIVGDGTTAQLSAMLTGIAEENQAEARRGKPGARTVDGWNWIFKDYKKHGYATLFSEDDPEIATFNYRLLGFREEPTDHYARPFWIALDKLQRKNCVGGMAIHNISFNYVQDFCDTYTKRPKFAFLLLSYLTHANMDTLSYADDDLVRLLRNLDANHMNNSIVIIFGDHGYRFSSKRQSLQGKLEERLPFLSMTVPKWFPWKYPEAYRNLKHNAEILTSPFDVYATLRHVLSYPALPSGIKTGQSLFDRIDEKARTCSQAGIDSHWCPCMQWEKIDSDQEISQKIANAFVKYVNNLTSTVWLCKPFQIKSIMSILKEMPNSKVRRFKKTKKTAKCDSCVPVYDTTAEKNPSIDGLYQLQIALYPGNGLFEATVHVIDGYPVVDTRFISRINAYGDQPHCIKTTHTHLVKYCYCRKQLK